MTKKPRYFSLLANSSAFPFSSTLGTYMFFNTAGLRHINLVFCSLYTKATHIQFSFTGYPSLLGRQKQHGMRRLSDTATCTLRWELNPRPFDFESDTLSTQPHAQIFLDLFTVLFCKDCSSLIRT